MTVFLIHIGPRSQPKANIKSRIIRVLGRSWHALPRLNLPIKYDLGPNPLLLLLFHILTAQQEPNVCQDGRLQMPGWDLIDGSKGVHYMSALRRLARTGTRASTNRPEKEPGCQRANVVSHNMRLDDVDKEYLRQKGAFTLPSQTCWYYLFPCSC